MNIDDTSRREGCDTVRQQEVSTRGGPQRAREEGGVAPYVDTLSPRYTTRRTCNTWRSLQGGEEGELAHAELNERIRVQLNITHGNEYR